MTTTRICLLVLVIALAAGFCLAAEPIGQVVGVDGDVTAIGEDGTTRALELKSPIYMNDVIRSGKDSRLQIMFSDDTLFAQGEKSEVTIDEYIYSPDDKANNSFMAKLGKGIYRVITGKITDLNPDRFKIKTGRATIGIRGCELGFQILDDFDLIMMARIPVGKSIHIDATGPTSLRGADARRFMNVNRAMGVFVGEDGTLKALPLESGDYRKVLGGTIPQRAGLVRGARRTGLPSDQGGFQGGGYVLGGGPLPPMGSQPIVRQHPPLIALSEPGPAAPFLPVGNVLPSSSDPILNPDDDFNASLQLADNTDPNEVDSLLQFPSLPPPDGSTGSGDGTTPDNTLPLIFSGGAAGALYSGASPRIIDETYMYKTVEGAFSLNQFDGHVYGEIINDDGTPLGPIDFPLTAIPLAQFGATDGYSGYQYNNILTDVIVGNDNLQQFVIIEDQSDITRTLTYFGYEAASYPGSRLPGGMVYTYDTKLLEHPGIWDAPSSPNDVQNVTLYLNTRTGAWYIPSGPNNLAIVASSGDLTFYGEESQGIGAVVHGPSGGNTETTSALAGLQEVGTEQPANTGQSTYFGYAMARTKPTPPSSDPFHQFNSANLGSDNFFDNEGQVVVNIDRDVAGHSVDMRINAYEDPASPATTDMHLNNNEGGGYVMNDGYEIYGTSFHKDGYDIQTFSGGGGPNWQYGPWIGERTVDYGSGEQGEQIEGTYVVGDTVDATTFQDLVNGSTAYTLASPPGLGWAEANVGDGTFETKLDGTCDMWVDIPGGGTTPTWGGVFDLSGGGDSLNIDTGTQMMTPNGHLDLTTTFASFAASVNGTAYSDTMLSSYEISGNIVGDSVNPVTGVIGDGRFEMNDGMIFDLLFGSDLQ